MNAEPLDITYTLPDYIYTHENDEIRVGVWDDKEMQWLTEHIDSLQYDKTNKVLTFTTTKLAPIAYL